MNSQIIDYFGVHALSVTDAAKALLVDGNHLASAGFGDDRLDMLDTCLSVLDERNGPVDGATTWIIDVAQTPSRDSSEKSLYGPRPAVAIERRGIAAESTILVSQACGSGIVAAALADTLISAGLASRVLVVGATTPNRPDFESFDAVRALTGSIVRPFDREASGTALGTFAAAILFGETDSSGTGIEVLGRSVRTNGGGASSTKEEQLAVILGATEGNRAPAAVIAHATGTTQGDASEASALEDASVAWGVPVVVSSQKGALGHAVHAAGLASIVGALQSIRTGLIPGTVNLRDPLPTEKRVRTLVDSENSKIGPDAGVLVNGFGFAGNNAAILLGRRPSLTRTNKGK